VTQISEEFVEKQVQELKERDDVRAIAVVGSYDRDPEGDHNDLDLYVIVEDEWRKRVTEEVNGVVVEKFFNSFEWSERYLEEDEDKWWENFRWFTGADVRYDPENIFEDLAERAEEVKEEKLSQDFDQEKFLYYVWDLKQDIEEEDLGQKRFSMYQLFDYLLEKAYELNDEVPVKENFRVKKLSEFDGYMYKLAQEFLNSSSTYEKEKKLEKMIEHVTRKIGEPGPEWETEKEFFDEK
jgi:hypothetical protein